MVMDEHMIVEARVGAANLCVPTPHCHTNVRVFAVGHTFDRCERGLTWQMAPMRETETLHDRPCPLCGAYALSSVLHDERRYYRCAECDLISVHPDDRPAPSDEAQRYLAHQNDGADDGYVGFLRRLADPLCAVVPPGDRGIDIGCGPAPVLGALLTESGRPTVSYDPLFFPDARLLDDRYDFVTASEVVEHAHDPAALFRQLVGLLLPGGTLGVMTAMHDATTNFATWWYRRDITHVCFYSMRTLQWVAEHFDLTLSVPASNVALFTLHGDRAWTPREAPAAVSVGTR